MSTLKLVLLSVEALCHEVLSRVFRRAANLFWVPLLLHPFEPLWWRALVLALVLQSVVFFCRKMKRDRLNEILNVEGRI
ncbi:hypothetical protein DEO45_07125 [Rhodanobacter denitrificans]|uniref:Uncharacterized protein n=1 Tax=Rhodanobacter denitrificans TaxID=666685 RepID=A0A368KF89_9GAMM|nr:hypothetical protein [Rhodanobacter denitrificans]RCS30582.1 hypothetical protein DEO45_07125 [Rhodanobacter denitrificans]